MFLTPCLPPCCSSGLLRGILHGHQYTGQYTGKRQYCAPPQVEPCLHPLPHIHISPRRETFAAAKSHPASSLLQLQACILGGDDLAASLGATRTPSNSELQHARGMFLLTCRAMQVGVNLCIEWGGGSLGATRTPSNTELQHARGMFLLTCRAMQVCSQSARVCRVCSVAALLVQKEHQPQISWCVCSVRPQGQ